MCLNKETISNKSCRQQTMNAALSSISTKIIRLDGEKASIGHLSTFSKQKMMSIS